MNMSVNAKPCHVTDAIVPTSASHMHVACVMPLPIIREPSFKSELHIPIIPTNKAKRLSPNLHPESALQESNRRFHGESFFGRVGKRLSKDQVNKYQGSSESLNFRRSQDDIISLKSFKDGALSPFVNKSPNWFRKKYVERQESQRRQVICKDLGGSDCEGWLWKKHDGSGHKSKKWVIRWFALDRKKLHYFKHEDDEEPLGVIHLPGLKICPAPEIKNKKFAFKAHHSGTKFFFAAESQDDMVKWMNKMGLASLEDLDLGRGSTTAGFKNSDSMYLDIDDTGLTDEGSSRSDSDDESTDSLYSSRLSSRPNSQRSSLASSREDLVDLYNKLHKANIGIDGSNIQEKRQTAFFNSIGNTEEEQKAYLRLLTLHRTLQDKEQQLRDINVFLQTNPIISEDIASFRKSHPVLVTVLEQKIKCEIEDEQLLDNCCPGGIDDNTTDRASTISSETLELRASSKFSSDSEGELTQL